MDKAEIERQIGVMLPGIDPMIGEVLIGAILSNQGASVPELITRLVECELPEPVRHDLVAAMLELVYCHNRGVLFWMDLKASSILTGARRETTRGSMTFGSDAEWPLTMLGTASPKSALIRTTMQTPAGPRPHAVRVWCAATPLDGIVVDQRAATALGAAMLQEFGAEVVGDTDAEQARRSAAEVQARLLALRQQAKSVGFCQTWVREARPGSLAVGDALYEVTKPDKLYTVTERLTEDAVLVQAREPGPTYSVPAGAWRKATDVGPWGPTGYTEWGFSDEAAVPAPPPPEEDADGEDMDPDES